MSLVFEVTGCLVFITSSRPAGEAYVMITMGQKSHISVVFGLMVLLIASPTYAIVAVPFLFIGNLFLFSIGLVWVVISESLYLKRLFPKAPMQRLLGTVVMMNIISTIMGALAIPLIVALTGVFIAEASTNLGLKKIASIGFVLGTWILDGVSVPLALIANLVGFFLCYVATVFIEKRYLAKKHTELGSSIPVTFRQCAEFNAISYFGLLIFALSTGAYFYIKTTN